LRRPPRGGAGGKPGGHRLYRRFALIHPDAFLPDLATSLDNLGVGLSNLGRGEEALAACQEAADIRRHLAESRPDAFLPNLAMSLNNLVHRFRNSNHIKPPYRA
jgi:hypothetical protein